MITRRTLLTGAAAAVVSSVAASAVIRENKKPKVCPCGVKHKRPDVPGKCWVTRTREASGFGMAPVKCEGGWYLTDPQPGEQAWGHADDPVPMGDKARAIIHEGARQANAATRGHHS